MPCWRCIKRLEGEGVIEGCRAVLHRRAGVLVFVTVSIDDHIKGEARAFLHPPPW